MAKIRGLPKSQYHYSFYATDCREPIHVHVKSQGKEAKIWVKTRKIAFNKGFLNHELTEILQTLAEYEAVIRHEWELFCNPDNTISTEQ